MGKPESKKELVAVADVPVISVASEGMEAADNPLPILAPSKVEPEEMDIMALACKAATSRLAVGSANAARAAKSIDLAAWKQSYVSWETSLGALVTAKPELGRPYRSVQARKLENDRVEGKNGYPYTSIALYSKGTKDVDGRRLLPAVTAVLIADKTGKRHLYPTYDSMVAAINKGRIEI